MSMTDVAKHFHTALQGLSDAHDAVYEAKAELRRLEGEHKGIEDAVLIGGVEGSNKEAREANLRTEVAKLVDQTVFEAAQRAHAEATRDLDVQTRLTRFLQSVADFEVAQAGETGSTLAALTAQEAF
jgi:hypothetical protein